MSPGVSSHETVLSRRAMMPSRLDTMASVMRDMRSVDYSPAMKVPCALAFLALTAGACAHTSDDAVITQSRTTTVSPIHDDADDATASLGEGWMPGVAAREAWIGERADVTFTVARPGA